MLPKCIMKLKTNQIILVVAIIVIMGWITLKSRRVELMSASNSELVLYIESRDVPNPFIAHDIAKKLTDDESKLEKILQLASEKRKMELLDFAHTL